MLYLAAALILAALPFGLISFYAFFCTLFILFPALLFGLYSYFRLSPASHSLVKPFTNISIAHRGGRPEDVEITAGTNSSDFPENTMAAFKWAQKDGKADGIELDVWLSAEGIPVVHHDENVQPKMEGKGAINQMTLRELKKLRYTRTKRPYNNEEYYDNEFNMATLEEVITWIEPTGMKLMIEVKEQNNTMLMAQNLVALYEKYPFLYANAWVASFNVRFLYELRLCSSRIVTSFLFCRSPSTSYLNHCALHSIPVSPLIRYNALWRGMVDDFYWMVGTHPTFVQAIGCNMIGIHNLELNDSLIKKYQSTTTAVSSWTVNNAHQQRMWMEQGVTVISDNKLGRAKESCN